MNTWIVKLGKNRFNRNDIINIKKFAGEQLPHHSIDLFEYETDHIHYISIPVNSEKGKINHHFTNGYLLGYSGLITANKNYNLDLRSAAQINAQVSSLTDIFEIAEGPFSLFKISETGFKCIVDCLATSKVYYCKHQDGHVYVSNHPKLLKLFKAYNPNVQFFIDYIVSSGTFGTNTDDVDISSLPEFGRLSWNDDAGLKVDSYKDLSNIINPQEGFDFLINETANQLKQTACYLSTYHRVVISLSGGFDSRIAINMFWNSHKDNVQAYTFPDHSIDTKLAKKIAKDHDIRHQLLNPSEYPDVESLHNYLERDQAPFFNYNNVFGYLFDQEITSTLKPDSSVLLTGLGGGTNIAVEIFNKMRGSEEGNVLNIFTDLMINRNYLTSDGFNETKDNFKEYLQNKYSFFSDKDIPIQKVSKVYYLLERFGSYQAHKNHISSLNKFEYYLPFGNLRFLQTAFASPIEKLLRYNKSSIHHQLSTKLVGNSSLPIRFTKNLHWEAGKIEKLKNISSAKLRKYFPNRRSLKQEKNSDILRETFFNENIDHYREVIFSYEQSSLWDYLDKTYVQSLFNKKENIYKQHSNLISKVVPLLKNGL